MFAVVRTGGKQYRVQTGDVLRVARLDGDKGGKVELSDVLVMGAGSDIGAKGAVSAEIIDHIRGEKVTIFKKVRRHTYKRKNGHRQDLTLVRITAVGSSTDKPAKKAAAKTEAADAPKPAKKATAKKTAKAENADA